MSSEGPYEGDGVLSPVDEWSSAKRLATGLQRRQLGLPPQFFQAKELEAFDAADLEGKRRMLGEYWPKWRAYIEREIARSPRRS